MEVTSSTTTTTTTTTTTNCYYNKKTYIGMAYLVLNSKKLVLSLSQTVGLRL